MKTVRMTIDVQNPIAKPVGRIDAVRVDATNEADVAKHKADDDAEAGFFGSIRRASQSVSQQWRQPSSPAARTEFWAVVWAVV